MHKLARLFLFVFRLIEDLRTFYGHILWPRWMDVTLTPSILGSLMDGYDFLARTYAAAAAAASADVASAANVVLLVIVCVEMLRPELF